MNDLKIDLVLPWVDGNDLEWQKIRNHYMSEVYDGGGCTPRCASQFREWNMLRFVFRSIEKNLSWINRIHFVTMGHLPPWLNIAHPKIHIVNHNEFIPKEYLPTFSSNTISLNLHRIPELTENFIYTNDDCLFMGKSEPTDFFRDGLPCDYLYLKPITETKNGGFGHILLNCINLINEEFDMHECYEIHKDKWCNAAYSEKAMAYNAEILNLCRNFPGFADDHMMKPFNKESYISAWAQHFSIFDRVCNNKFRTLNDVFEWYIRYRRLCLGRFTPYVLTGRCYCDIWVDETVLNDAILSEDTKYLCLNDSAGEGDFEFRKKYINSLLEQVFPSQSSYETYPIEKEESSKTKKDRRIFNKVGFPEIICDEASLNAAVGFIMKNTTKFAKKTFILKIASSFYGLALQRLFLNELTDSVELCKEENFVEYIIEHSDVCVVSPKNKALYTELADKYNVKVLILTDEVTA